MQLKGRNYVWLFFSILITLMIAAYLLNVVFNNVPAKPRSIQANDNTNSSSYVSIRNPQGAVILQTGVPVSIDDEFISQDNTRYIVTSVDGQDAMATPKAAVEPAAPSGGLKEGPGTAVPVVASNKPRHVVLYNTHTDESYVPNSGAESQPGAGDVYQVAATLGGALEKSGVSVSQSVNAHDPHDINAYSRSRRTVVQLLKQQPDAAFDIHRDSAPGESYVTSVNGVEVGRIMIVVGRSNPNFETNLDFASRIKDATDSLYPGLLRGIFIGKGDYNQDLYPTALLFEVGSQDTPLDNADKAVNCLTDGILTVLNQR
ncbi:MAG: stage II sporulation protein P [Syntrophomonas sp.]